jgi:hypothetical protein
MKLAYLSPEYFDEIIFRIENEGSGTPVPPCVINVRDKDEWINEFKKVKPLIRSIELTHINGMKYRVSANI